MLHPFPPPGYYGTLVVLALMTACRHLEPDGSPTCINRFKGSD